MLGAFVDLRNASTTSLSLSFSFGLILQKRLENLVKACFCTPFPSNHGTKPHLQGVFHQRENSGIALLRRPNRIFQIKDQCLPRRQNLGEISADRGRSPDGFQSFTNHKTLAKVYIYGNVHF